MQTTERLMEFIADSPSPYHAVRRAGELLEQAGFSRLAEGEVWAVRPGGAHFVTRDQSSLIAFRAPEGKLMGWRMVAAHSDSPTFRVKNDVLPGDGKYVRLAVEGYGGMNCASWLDRPLSVAGRAVVRTDSSVESRLVALDRDLVTIPSLAIHQQREINRGHEYNAQRDMQPVYGLCGGKPLTALVAEELGTEMKNILSADLSLYVRQKPVFLGVNQELFQAPRIDDLGCAYSALEGLLRAEGNRQFGQVYCLFDSEEVGSGTRQGALGSFLGDVLDRIGECLGMSGQERQMALAGSFLVSADNGHAVHPNFPEKADPANQVYPNGGVVIKLAASQKYTTTAVTAGVFRAVCQQAGIPVQTFANRADEPGGSTLGNLLARQVSIPMVDVGMAQLAMHSAVETAGSVDPGYVARACEAVFRSEFSLTGDGVYRF